MEIQAIRAIRHPERYGRRLADPTVGGSAALAQSRARGLGRAILDTFPVVKFRLTDDQESAFSRPKDIESPPVVNESAPVAFQPNAVELLEMTKRSTEERGEHQPEPQEGEVSTQRNTIDCDVGEDRPIAGTSQSDALPPARPRVRTADGAPHSPSSVRGGDGLMPDSIGRETCPICIVDFEEGDDLRVLPCEGKHRFHQACVDPWLLELSGSCPICRQGMFDMVPDEVVA
jgi:hypothetical protein